MAKEIDNDRRNLLRSGMLAIATAGLGMAGSAYAQSPKANAANGTAPALRTRASFSSLKQIQAGLLNVGYAEAGPASGRPVMLLHGWPYDIYTYVDVAPLLAAAGYRVIVPFLRGYGSTRFISNETVRNAQPAAVATDIVAFMDALKIDKAVIGGCD